MKKKEINVKEGLLVQNFSKIQTICSYFLEKQEVLDIILMQERELSKEKMIVLVVFQSKEERALENQIEGSFAEQGLVVKVEGVLEEQLFSPEYALSEKVIFEGYSMRYQCHLSARFNYTGYYLFQYSLQGLNASERMQFYYALYGRKASKGACEEHSMLKLSDSLMVVPLAERAFFGQFFVKHSIPVTITPILTPMSVAQKWFPTSKEQ